MHLRLLRKDKIRIPRYIHNYFIALDGKALENNNTIHVFNHVFLVRETVRQMLAAVDPESVQLRRKHRLMRRRYNSKVYSLRVLYRN